MQHKLFPALVAAFIVFLYACSKPATKLPPAMLGVWTEDRVKETLTDNPTFVKSTGYTAIRFEQPDQSAVVFVSSFYDPIKQEYTWSQPYPLHEAGNNSWSFSYYKREVSLRLDDKNQLQVKGLTMRSYNQALVKKEPEPVEAIFIKKS